MIRIKHRPVSSGFLLAATSYVHQSLHEESEHEVSFPAVSCVLLSHWMARRFQRIYPDISGYIPDSAEKNRILKGPAYDWHHLAVEAGPHPSWLLEADRHWRALFGGAPLRGGAWAAWHVRADGDGRKKPAGRLTSPGDTAGGRGRPQGCARTHTRAHVRAQRKAAQTKG